LIRIEKRPVTYRVTGRFFAQTGAIWHRLVQLSAERANDMDEYRGRSDAYHRRWQEHPHHPHTQEEPPAPPPCEPELPRGPLSNFGIESDWLEEYLPILLILIGALGVYLWMARQGSSLGGLLGGFLK